MIAPTECLQRLLRERALAGSPYALRCHLDERDLIACPSARCRAVDGKGRDPSTVLDQRRVDERRDVAGEELSTLIVREPWVRVDVGDHDSLATLARLDDGVTEAGDGTSIGEWRDGACIEPPDDELVPLDVRIIDAARLEMLTDQPDGDLLDLDRIPQGTQPLVQRDQKLPLGGHGEVGILVL